MLMVKGLLAVCCLYGFILVYFFSFLFYVSKIIFLEDFHLYNWRTIGPLVILYQKIPNVLVHITNTQFLEPVMKKKKNLVENGKYHKTSTSYKRVYIR